METLSSWDALLLGAMVLLVIFWMGPGIKAAIAQSKTMPSDWAGVLLPLGFVVVLVILLIAMV